MNNEEGSSLIEVLVAFAILSIVVIMGLRIFSDGLARLHIIETRAEELAVARSALNEVSARSDFASGRFEGKTASGIAWSVTITDAYVTDRLDWTALRPMKAEMRIARGRLSEADAPLLETIVLVRDGRAP